MEDRYQSLQSQGYKQYLLINSNSSGGAPTAAYCKQVRAQYELTFPVLYDPLGTFTSTYGFAGSNEQNLVIKAGGVIVYKQRYANQSTVLQQIQSVLP